MTQSTDGCTVVSAAGDETLRFWNVFGVPETVRIPVTKAARGPFSHVARIETVKASLQGKPLIDN
ncbi:BnaA09g08730D [Brassica napus]|uniref:BnaA09g08730D protein n=4 Tax=Brassica TaxID=3705 RepID=A0A078IDN0_BRANA|nr:BnaA09g08730D [Brassica napus]VDC59129.1 unnamed protein product [Brassica rapa]